MTHLTDLEILAIAEGGAPAERRESAHLDACGACREKLAGLRDALSLATAADVPEPSPLFWEHFSSRVRTSLQDAEPGAAAGWRDWFFGAPFKVATGAAVILLIAIAGVMWRTGAPGTTTERSDMIPGVPGSVVRDSGALPAWDLDDQTDGAWALVRDAADDVSWDDAVAAGWMVAPGSADNAVLTLTAEERGALMQLLRAETKRSGA